MKRILLLLILAKCLTTAGYTQEPIKATSKPKVVKYGQTQAPVGLRLLPDLVIMGEKFQDENGNNMIDADEKFYILLQVHNIGKGEAKNVKVLVHQNNEILSALSFTSNITLGDILPDRSVDVTIHGKAAFELKDGTAEFVIDVIEERGLDAYPLQMRIEAASFREPKLVIADAVFSTEDGGTIKLNYPIILKMLAQNIGYGQANQVRAEFTFPQPHCLVLGDTNTFFLGKVGSGESRQLDFIFTASRRYTQQQIPVRIRLTEQYKKYTLDTTLHVNLNQSLLASNQVVIQASKQPETEIRMASLFAEVDRNIPVNQKKNPKKFALVIGNEDYQKYQRSLSSEINVTFARHDAAIMKEYLIQTLGYEESNVYLLTDATTGEMLQKIDLVTKLCQKAGDDSELLFYYAGHGLPDDNTRSAYLIPVDVSGTNLSAAIKLSDIYAKFSQAGASRITVILDACFSGGGREMGLIAARGVRIKPRDDMLTGNMVVFSASSGEQSAMPHREKQHGLFTYYLLKKLQETSGKISYGELGRYLKQTVSLESLKINQKEQDPQINTSPAVEGRWEQWKWYE